MKRGNQFTIYFDKENHWCNGKELQVALSSLNGVALKLYIYFSAHSPNTFLDFFPVMFCEYANVSMTAEKNAFKELQENGYLTEVEPSCYIFTTSKK